MAHTAIAQQRGDTALVTAWAGVLADAIPRYANSVGQANGVTWISNSFNDGPVFALQPSTT